MAIVGLVISVEPIIDMGRTMLNVNDSMIAGVVSSKRLKTFDETIFNDDSAVVKSDI